jgi:hypothetical protein
MPRWPAYLLAGAAAAFALPAMTTPHPREAAPEIRSPAAPASVADGERKLEQREIARN